MARHLRAYLGPIATHTDDNVDFRRVVATGRHLMQKTKIETIASLAASPRPVHGGAR